MAGEYSPEIVQDLHDMAAKAPALFGLPPETRITLLNLSENATFLLSDEAGGRDLVLRVHRVGYSSPEEIRSELEWLNALRTGGVIETAAPLPGEDGELVHTLHSPSGRASRHAVAFERLAGVEPGAGGAAGEASRWFERLGELTAKMHRHAKSWPLPDGFSRKRWDAASMAGEESYWGAWRKGIGLDAAGAVVLERALSCIRHRLEKYGNGADRFGLVHADLRLANLLADGGKLRIIDFDDCGFGWFMYDFATTVSFMEHEPVVPELLAGWLKGYRRVAPLTAEDLAEIPTFIVLRRILLTAWVASHIEVPFARALGAGFTAGTVALAQKFISNPEYISNPDFISPH
jgi:Ser/Thr protein kinase RdoA (MazF antagonist)